MDIEEKTEKQSVLALVELSEDLMDSSLGAKAFARELINSDEEDNCEWLADVIEVKMNFILKRFRIKMDQDIPEEKKEIIVTNEVKKSVKKVNAIFKANNRKEYAE